MQRDAERYGEGPNFKVDESQAVIEVLHQGSLEALPAFGSLLLPVIGSLPNSTFRLKTGYMSLPLRTPGGFMAEIVLDPDFELPGLESRWVLWEPAGLGRCCVQLSRSGLLRLSRPFPQLHTRQRARPTRRLQTERLFSTI